MNNTLFSIHPSRNSNIPRWRCLKISGLCSLTTYSGVKRHLDDQTSFIGYLLIYWVHDHREQLVFSYQYSTSSHLCHSSKTNHITYFYATLVRVASFEELLSSHLIFPSTPITYKVNLTGHQVQNNFRPWSLCVSVPRQYPWIVFPTATSGPDWRRIFLQSSRHSCVGSSLLTHLLTDVRTDNSLVYHKLSSERNEPFEFEWMYVCRNTMALKTAR